MTSGAQRGEVRGKGMYFIKGGAIVNALEKEDFTEGRVVSSEFNGGGAPVLENLTLLSQEIYLPLLSNPANRAGWSGPTSKEVMLDFSTFLSRLTMAVGHSKGVTRTPSP